MTLFVVKHQHKPETCPAKDPRMGAMLLAHLGQANASKYGIKVQGEGVIEGGHALYLIADAPSKEKVEEFMGPFAMAGSVEVMKANSCEVVVKNKGC